MSLPRARGTGGNGFVERSIDRDFKFQDWVKEFWVRNTLFEGGQPTLYTKGLDRSYVEITPAKETLLYSNLDVNISTGPFGNGVTFIAESTKGRPPAGTGIFRGALEFLRNTVIDIVTLPICLFMPSAMPWGGGGTGGVSRKDGSDNNVSEIITAAENGKDTKSALFKSAEARPDYFSSDDIHRLIRAARVSKDAAMALGSLTWRRPNFFTSDHISTFIEEAKEDGVAIGILSTNLGNVIADIFTPDHIPGLVEAARVNKDVLEVLHVLEVLRRLGLMRPDLFTPDHLPALVKAAMDPDVPDKLVKVLGDIITGGVLSLGGVTSHPILIDSVVATVETARKWISSAKDTPEEVRDAILSSKVHLATLRLIGLYLQWQVQTGGPTSFHKFLKDKGYTQKTIQELATLFFVAKSMYIYPAIPSAMEKTEAAKEKWYGLLAEFEPLNEILSDMLSTVKKEALLIPANVVDEWNIEEATPGLLLFPFPADLWQPLEAARPEYTFRLLIDALAERHREASILPPEGPDFYEYLTQYYGKEVVPPREALVRALLLWCRAAGIALEKAKNPQPDTVDWEGAWFDEENAPLLEALLDDVSRILELLR